VRSSNHRDYPINNWILIGFLTNGVAASLGKCCIRKENRKL
jgi:hypothetical protein